MAMVNYKRTFIFINTKDSIISIEIIRHKYYNLIITKNLAWQTLSFRWNIIPKLHKDVYLGLIHFDKYKLCMSGTITKYSFAWKEERSA
jgi:hypothetical protein